MRLILDNEKNYLKHYFIEIVANKIETLTKYLQTTKMVIL